MAKIVSTAVRTPSLLNTSNGSNWPIVEKLGLTVSGDGTWATPATSATTVVMAMLMSSAARIFSANSATVIARPSRKTNWPAVVGNASVTSVPSQNPSVAESGAQLDTISPPLAKPMNRMNRPMPTPIDRFSASGTAFMIASRRPTATRMVMTTPSRTMTPIAPLASRPLPGQRERDDGVDAEARGQGERIVRGDAHRDGHDPADERGAGRHRDRVQAERLGDDARVEEDDVGHDHERGHAGADLGRQVGLALGELEIRRDRVHGRHASILVVRRAGRLGPHQDIAPPYTAEDPSRPRADAPESAGSHTRLPMYDYSSSRASRPSSSIWTKSFVSNSSWRGANGVWPVSTPRARTR